MLSGYHEGYRTRRPGGQGKHRRRTEQYCSKRSLYLRAVGIPGNERRGRRPCHIAFQDPGTGLGSDLLLPERLHTSPVETAASQGGVAGKGFLPLFPAYPGASLAWGIGFTSYSAFMGHLGTDATAANSVAAVVRDLVCCLCNGLASGGGILVGNELGAGDLKKGKLYGDRLVKLAFLTGGLSTAIMLVLTPVIMSFVKLTPGAQKYLLGMMLIMAFYMIGRAVNSIIINGIFAAGGDTMFDMYSLGVTMWCIAVPLAAAGTFLLHWPVLVVYACTCLDEVGKIPWVLHHYRKNKWVRDLTRKTIDREPV